jgi:hypothetical protein
MIDTRIAGDLYVEISQCAGLWVSWFLRLPRCRKLRRIIFRSSLRLKRKRPPTEAASCWCARKVAVVGSWLLRDPRHGGGAHCGELYDHLSVLRPNEVRRALRFGEKRARGIRFQLAFIPLLAQTEIVIA